MKTTLFLLLSFFSLLFAHGQNLKPGYYKTADGAHYRNVQIESNGNIKAEVSYGWDVYQLESGNKYKGITTAKNGKSTPAAKDFYLEIISDKEIYLYQAGQNKTKLTYQGATMESAVINDCELYKKYLEKLSSGNADVQIVSFCASGAMQLCNSKDDEFKKMYMKQITKSIKSVSTSTTCPCSDVIPIDIWENN